MSRRHGFWLALLALGLSASGCASKEASQRAEVQKLQARAAYDRALSYLNDKQPAPAVTALQEAINVNPSSPVYRDTLGMVLLELGRAKEAEAAFRADMKKFPDNGWSLTGLQKSLEQQGRAKEAAEVKAKLEKAWRLAQ